jgi:Icc-related predicted phosphoesterase
MKKILKICVISDTHGEHEELIIPTCDILVHCGDSTSLGKEHSVKEFLKWFSGLEQCRKKIFIPGNHDFLFERESEHAETLIPENVIYLNDRIIEIEGVKFYGTPVTPVFHNWAFNKTEEQLIEYWKKVPEKVDFLITHGPPLDILDVSPWTKTHCGSKSLKTEVFDRIKPKYHCFGHIHDCYGIETINGITFVNASNLNEQYEVSNEPIIIEYEKD